MGLVFPNGGLNAVHSAEANCCNQIVVVKFLFSFFAYVGPQFSTFIQEFPGVDSVIFHRVSIGNVNEIKGVAVCFPDPSEIISSFLSGLNGFVEAHQFQIGYELCGVSSCYGQGIVGFFPSFQSLQIGLQSFAHVSGIFVNASLVVKGAHLFGGCTVVFVVVNGWLEHVEILEVNVVFVQCHRQEHGIACAVVP